MVWYHNYGPSSFSQNEPKMTDIPELEESLGNHNSSVFMNMGTPMNTGAEKSEEQPERSKYSPSGTS